MRGKSVLKRAPLIVGVGLLLQVVPLLAAVGVIIIALVGPPRVLPRLDLAPSFRLTDSAGRQVTSEDLRGAIVVYSFVGAACDASCQQVLRVLKELEKETAVGGAATVRLVTIVTEELSPRELEALAAEVGSSSGNWLILGGDERATRLAREAFGVPVVRMPSGSTRVEPYLVLVDPVGMVRAEYRAPLPSADVLREDLTVLEDEIANSRGAMRYFYEGMHLFTCTTRG